MPFPPDTSRYAPVAIVTTRGGTVVSVEDRRIIDTNRARVYRNDADPANVIRATAGDVLLTDGTVVRYDPTTRNGLPRGGGANTDFLYSYGTLPVVVDGEHRLEIYSYHFPEVGVLGSEADVTVHVWWHYYTDEGVRLLVLEAYAESWPTTNKVIGKAATVAFHAVNRLNTAGGSDYSAGTVLSVTDARPSLGA